MAPRHPLREAPQNPVDLGPTMELGRSSRPSLIPRDSLAGPNCSRTSCWGTDRQRRRRRCAAPARTADPTCSSGPPLPKGRAPSSGAMPARSLDTSRSPSSRRRATTPSACDKPAQTGATTCARSGSASAMSIRPAAGHSPRRAPRVVARAGPRARAVRRAREAVLARAPARDGRAGGQLRGAERLRRVWRRSGLDEARRARGHGSRCARSCRSSPRTRLRAASSRSAGREWRSRRSR